MIAHRETRLVPYPAALMYAVVCDVEKYPQFLPWVLALRVLSRHENGMTAEMAVGYGALRERYTSDIKLDPRVHRIDVVQVNQEGVKGPFKTLENHWQFTPCKGGCEVTFSILFEFKSRLLHSVAGAKFEKVMLKMADAFEARAAALSNPVS
ncbi:MAG TPA: type II toxin-antitoxin system RatA family toxin [Rhizomicrobium sp.]|nr:type II toxin-antitoxin system RatA family toxin [Rhizomicrobium sp.]